MNLHCNNVDKSSRIPGPAPWYNYIMTPRFIYCIFYQKFQNFINSEMISTLPQTQERTFRMRLLESGPSPLLLSHLLYSHFVQTLAITSSLDIHTRSKWYSFFFLFLNGIKNKVNLIIIITFLKKTMCYSRKSGDIGIKYALNLAFDGFQVCNLS